MVTTGTWWKYASSNGDTPSWADMVVAAASATGFGSHPRRAAMGAASATMPTVAATESWNPTDHTSVGFATSSARTAAPSRVAVVRGRPSTMPASAKPAMTPARSTDGSAPVSTTKNITVARPSTKRPRADRRRSTASPTIGASTMATFSPDTASRWPSPVARKCSSSARSSRDVSPRASPISRPAWREGNRSASRSTSAVRTAWAARTSGFADGPSRKSSRLLSTTAIPRWSRYTANGPLRSGSAGPDTSTRSPRRARGGGPNPSSQTASDVARSSLRPSSHATRTLPPPSTAVHPRPERPGSSASEPHTVTSRGTRLARAPRWTRNSCSPAQPAPSRPKARTAATTTAPGGARATPEQGSPRACSGAGVPGGTAPARRRAASETLAGAARVAHPSARSPAASSGHGGPSPRESGQARIPAQNAPATTGTSHAVTPTARTRGRPWPSHRDQRPKLLESGRPDAADVVEGVHRREGPVRGSVRDDLLGQHRTDPGKGLQLLRGGRVDVHERPRSAGRRARSRRRRTRDTARPPPGDQDLLAVRDTSPPAAGGGGPGARGARTSTGLGSDRTYHSPAPATTTAASTASTASSRRDSAARRSRTEIRSCISPAHRTTRDRKGKGLRS